MFLNVVLGRKQDLSDLAENRTEQLRKLGKDYHMLPRLVQPDLGVFIRRGCETKQRCSNGTT